MNFEPTAVLDAAVGAAERAASFLREQEGRLGPAHWSEKGKADFVTEVDRESERLIAAALTDAFPASTVVGEELSPGAPDDRSGAVPSSPGPPVPRLCWFVDPLDGTTNFLHRFPMYCISIGAAVDGVLEAGCVLHVTPDIHYTAVRGLGARQDGRPVSVSDLKNPRHALIGTGFPFRDLERQLPRYLRMFSAVAERTSGLRRPGSAALDLCDVAAGRFDGFFELRLAPWDVAAGTLMVREAGGAVTTLEGDADVLHHNSILAGNPVIHAWLMELFRASREAGAPAP